MDDRRSDLLVKMALVEKLGGKVELTPQDVLNQENKVLLTQKDPITGNMTIYLGKNPARSYVPG